MKIKVMVIIFAFTCISNLYSSVTEKLAANRAKIETLRKEIKTGSLNKTCSYCSKSKNCKTCSVAP